MRSFYITILSFVLLVAGTAAVKSSANKRYVSNFENVLGTSLEIKIDAAFASVATRAEDAALKEIERLNAVLSSYKMDSEFNLWASKNAGPVKVSADLFEVLSLFDAWEKNTHGALSPAAETIGKVWKKAGIEQKLPSTAVISSAVNAAAATHWKLNKANGTATRIGNAPLALNTFVKSYIINKAAAVALNIDGVTGVVVNIGGDIVVKGAVKETIDISNPMASAENDRPLTTINVSNKAIATSGNYRRGYQINNKWYSHIVNPLTGKPVEDIISATVVAADASTAGALATAMNVLSVEESIALAATKSGVEYLIVQKNGAEIKSPGWNAITKKRTPAVRNELSINAADNAWDTRYELTINLELALIQGQRIHRPFAAIWVEDADKKPIRNLAIWYNKARWLPDIKTWYRAYGLNFAPEGNSSTGATRSPGKYTLKWDGKDDKGNLVKAGDYTINIEVVREHGTYQLITQEMSFKGAAKKINLPSNVEVASASLDYRKKTK